MADLPSWVSTEPGITAIPTRVRFGEQVYCEGIDPTSDQFYEKLKETKTLPVISVPSLGTFAEAYDRLAEGTDEMLAVIASSKLSGTYEVARQSIGLKKRKCWVGVIDLG